MQAKRKNRSVSVEFLETRRLLTSVVVNTIADVIDAQGSSTVSLPDAIAVANAASSPTTITFDSTVFASAQTIDLTTPLELTNTTQATTITGPSATLTLKDDTNSNTMGALNVDASVTATVSSITFTTGTAGNTSSNGNAVNAGSLTLTSDTFNGGGTDRAIYNSGTLSIGQSLIENHGDGSAGITVGAAIRNSGTVTITNTTLSNNDAFEAGAVFQSGGTFKATASTFVNNSTDSGSGGTFIVGDGTVTLVNSTIAGSAVIDQNGTADGVAIYISNTAQVNLNDSTINGSSYNDEVATAAASNIFITSGGTLTLGNTVIGSLAETLNGSSSSTPGDAVNGAVNSLGNNLISVSDGSTGFVSSDLTGTASSVRATGLGSLASNGGSTQTELPGSGSALIDHGSNSIIPSGITTDQRGDARISNTTVDIGAVEVQQVVTTTLTATAASNQTATVGTSATFSLGSFTESNATAPYTVTVNWGDSTANTVFTTSTVGTLTGQAHTFASAGAKTVSVSIADSASHTSNSATFTITASAAVGTTIGLTAPSAQTATIGQSQSISLGSFTESNATAPYTVTVIWGDGSANTVFTTSAVGTLTAQAHTFASAGAKTVSVSVADSASHTSNTAMFTVTASTAVVTSIGVTAPSAQTALVGQSQSISLGSFTASNATAPYTVTVNWGDSSTNTVFTTSTVGTITSQSHTFAGGGVKTVSVTVADSASHTSNTATFQVTASVATPSIAVTSAVAQTATMGTSQVIKLGSFTESNATAPYSVTVNWGDSSTNTVFSTSTPGTIASQSHTFASSGGKTVSVTITDAASHTSNTATFAVTVAAASATTIAVTPPANQIATVGKSQAMQLGSFAETNATAPYTVTVNWGDTSANTVFTMAAAGALTAQAHSFAAAGTDTVIVTVADSAGHASTPVSFQVTTAAVTATTIVVTPPVDQAAVIGQSQLVQLGSFVATNATGPYSITVNWGDGSNAVFSTATVGTITGQSHTYTLVGVETVSVTITDSVSHTSNTASFQVTSAAPVPSITLTPAGNQTATIGEAKLFDLGSFTESNITGTFTATVDWGDHTTTSVPNLTAGTIPAQSHTYSSTTSYTVTVSVADTTGDTSTNEPFTAAIFDAGTAVELGVVTQPTPSTAGLAITPVVISVEDASGNVVTTDHSNITLTLAGAAGTLAGTTTVAAVNGVATFSDLSINVGGSYTLTATDGTQTPVTTTPFVVNSSVFTPTTARSTLPTAAVAGLAIKGTEVVYLKNNAAVVERGIVKISIYASKNGVVDANSTLLNSVLHKVAIKAGKLSAIGVTIKLIPSSLLGSYSLLIEITDASGDVAQTTTGPGLSVAAPFLSITAGLAALRRAESGDTLTINNLGNVIDTTRITYTAGFSLDAAGTQTIGKTATFETGVVHIKAGKSVRIHLNAWKKILGGLIYGDPYYLTVHISDASGDTAFAVSASDFALS